MRGPIRSLTAAACVGALMGALLLPTAARAQARGEVPVTAPPERRNGLILGTTIGNELAFTAGTPNDARKIDDPAARVSSGALLGSTLTLHLMGALSDLVNFGVWFGSGSAQDDRWRSEAAGGGFRLEAFPLYHTARGLRDLGFYAQAGVGLVTLTDKSGATEGAKGTESFVGAGAFYEWPIFDFLGGHLKLGPALGYSLVASQATDRHGALLAGRLVFYGGGPPAAPPTGGAERATPIKNGAP